MTTNKSDQERNNFMFPSVYQVNFCQYSFTPISAYPSSYNNIASKKPRKTRIRNPINAKDKGSIKFENNEALKLFGARMREARELNRFTQVWAAKQFGYSNSSKLNKIECGSDTSTVPLWVIIKASNLYDVSTDFLFGISAEDDWERDPVISQQRQIGAWLFDHWERAKLAEVNAIRVLYNKIVTLEKLASHAITRSKENLETIENVQRINPEFDEIRGGAKLLRLLAETAEEAVGISCELKRFRCLVDVAKSENINLDMFKES